MIGAFSLERSASNDKEKQVQHQTAKELISYWERGVGSRKMTVGEADL